MSDIFEEVDESIRQDRISKLWKQYGMFVWLAAGLLIAAVAYNEYRQSRLGEDALARGSALDAALVQLDDGKYVEATASLQALVDAKTPMSPLAAHYLAQAKYKGGGDTEGAAAVLVGIGAVDGEPYEKLALLKAAYLRADTLNAEELEAMLGGLIADEGALGALSRELMAAKMYALGDIAGARTAFNRLKFEPAAPNGVRERAEIALAAMPAAPEAETPTTPETPAETAAPVEIEETRP